MTVWPERRYTGTQVRSRAHEPRRLRPEGHGAALATPGEVERVLSQNGSTDDQLERVTQVVRVLLEKNEQLETALESRISIEQAKGVLAERYSLEMKEAFELLRSAARSTRRNLHDLAAEVASSRTTPVAIEQVRSPR